ncbi:sulfotransferase domain-containing protein [Pelagibius sp.]|uniref:sulfotransferase domain-containing protein n=1 Tax=Pelagibius sp. TaxID=1931238 RepID=UPI00262E02DA|nr:sulfotransferase domain-containing protein [Pelagibius sp.]
MPGILWLASYPKSGNTWMRVFLANLILAGDEPLALPRINEVCPSEPNEIWFKPFSKKPVHELSRERLAALRTKAQDRAVSLNKHVIPMKTHSYLGEDFGHPIISMAATKAAIYIIRDPRDVVISAADHYGISIDETIRLMNDPEARGRGIPGQIVYERIGSWSVHVDSWTKWRHPGILVARYEDLLADPLDQFTRVAKHVGIPASPEQIERAVTFASFKALQKQEAESGFAERSEHSQRFFRSGRSGGWRDKLTAQQVRQIELDHGVQMNRFGYH